MTTPISVSEPITAEHISHKPGDPNAWKCLCGNGPSDAGFYPISRAGSGVDREVEPTAEDWPNGEYFCAQCGRVFHPDTLLVTRRVNLSTLVRL